MDLYLTLDAFPEVPDVLRRLKAAGIKTAIPSNGTPDMLEAAVRNAGIGDLLDAVLQSKQSASTSRIRRSTTWPLIGSRCLPRGDLVPVIEPGTPTPPLLLACASYGATATGGGPSACRASRITRSSRWRSCPRWSGA
jgi:phosphoglycolate phosphatase-like HAD superfamily hydrolase